MRRQHLRGPSVFLAVLLPIALLAIAGGCGNGTDDAGDPLPSTKIDVHEFSFDTADRTYEVLGEIIPEDDVLRDLAGSLCSKCHAGIVDELKDSRPLQARRPDRPGPVPRRRRARHARPRVRSALDDRPDELDQRRQPR